MTELRPISPVAWMPDPAPLAQPVQDLRAAYRDGAAPELAPPSLGVRLWRAATFLPAILITTGLIAVFTDFFAMNGLSASEAILIGLVALTFFWISLSVTTVSVGIFNLLRRTPKALAAQTIEPLNVALLVPIYNESPADVFGNACAMIEELHAAGARHDFALYILSDTRDERIAAQELTAFAALRAKVGGLMPVYYRRRAMNIDRKVGNLADWVEHWGGGSDAMLVLDADSLMSGEAIVALSDALAADPSAGLIQSFPQLFGAETLFARVQQFASTIYGSVLSEGLAAWADREGNYWGHNAIIRTRAFASCAGLPKLNGIRAKGALILSHDFVEAGLLRRAGWAVRFLPRVKGSYEEVPATLIDYIKRDRRWCQGNLQHLRLLRSKGFHTVTRFHLFHGAMSYLLSPAWFVLLTIWALIGQGPEANVIQYFSGANPQVNWPEMAHVNNLFILFFMYGMLLAPKFLGASAISSSGLRLRDLGGAGQFSLSFISEVVISILYAPILMVQQTVAVCRALLGFKEQWAPQTRRGHSYGLWTLVKFHWLETLMGAGLVAGMSTGLVTLWLLPIAVSLAGAIPLSALSGLNLTRHRWMEKQLGTQEVFNAPAIIRAAKAERAQLQQMLDQTDRIAAE